MEQPSPQILAIIVEETGLRLGQVVSVAELLREGGTVPFIARYRKERTGELDEVAIRTIEERLSYLSELEERKNVIRRSIDEQGKLSPELATRIDSCRQKTELEDLYLPYKPKRRTKATIARERGLEPLADLIAAQEITSGTLDEVALPFVDLDRDVPDVAAALAGASHILAERLAEDADSRGFVRRLTAEEGVLCSRVDPAKAGSVSKFEMYYDYREPLKAVPSHRMLAMRRGEKEELLLLTIEAPVESIVSGLTSRLRHKQSIFGQLLATVAEDAYRRLMAPSIEVELRLEAKNRADDEAIRVFAANLRTLLLAPPAGSKGVLGVDPGLRTGCKLAVVDATGRLDSHTTIYPHTGEAKSVEARRQLLKLIQEHPIEMVAVGNGTAGRETEQFIRQALSESARQPLVVMVSEAGASVYSASDVARQEFPDLDLTVRGAVSIARRLQDPLAELVKIDPKSIGVGQYQHDVNQSALKRSLDAVVESCVNFVGVELNTASPSLLAYVAGIGPSLAQAIVSHRQLHGPFSSRRQLLEVSRFGAKAFEQGAGFLRIRGGDHPLDATAVHPERYPLVERMASDSGVSLAELVQRPDLAARIDLKRYVSDEVGMPTLRDILEELKKPGRDPRQEFTTTAFSDEIREMTDLAVGMVLPGVVTNVAAFGAFVDIGVHQDGLVHVSHLAHRFVRDPNEAVQVGDQVRVKVLGVDLPRKRISLSIKEATPAPAGGERQEKRKPEKEAPKAQSPVSEQERWAQAGFRVGKKR